MNPYGLTNNYSLNGQRHQHYSPNHFKLPYFQSTFRQAEKRPSLANLAEVNLEPEDYVPETPSPSPVANLFCDNYVSAKGIPDLTEIENSEPDQIMIFTQTEDLIQPGLSVSPEIYCSKNELNTYLKILDEYPDPVVQRPVNPQYVPAVESINNPSKQNKVISEELKRKRESNRVAAAKCRRRKIERIEQLQRTVTVIENSNSEIENMIGLLKKEVYDMEFELSQHVNNVFCPIDIVGNQIVMN